MASASVVGQHPGPHGLDSEPPLLLLKLAGGRNKTSLPRKPSWERKVFKRGAEPAAVSAGEGESRRHRWSPGESVAGGERLSGEGCVAPAATRSPDRDVRGGCAGCGTAVATRDGRTGRTGGDCNRNVDCDSNRNTGGRSGSSSQPADTDVMPGRPARNEHKGGDARRDTWSGSSAERVPSSGPPPGRGRGLPLDRLTQGRTGVVRLARTEPARREAWSIFPRGMDPRVRTETGEGHRFEAKPVTQDWCDACSRQIRAQTLKCQNCSYTCHLECERSIQLDCNQRDKEPKQTPSPRSHCSSSTPQHKQNEAKGEDERGTKDLSEEEVRTRIEEYNAQDPENVIKLASDGSFKGFIKVHLRLSRPVTVTVPAVQGSEGASRQTDDHNTALCESLEETDYGCGDNRTSFYLPCDSVKHVHITSLHTTREVIQGLLKKFMVLDNPRKFALYRQTHRDGQDLFQKLPPCERPLLLQLIAGPDPQQLSFVLKENETGEVEWHAFSVPELQNFLVILEKEEAERVRVVEQKYVMYRQKLQKALQKHDP